MDTRCPRGEGAPCRPVSAVEIVVVAIAAVLGGAAQSVLGFGAAFTTVPAIAIVAPELLPGSALLAFLPLSAAMLVRERHHVDRRAALRLSIARLPGIALGAAAVRVLDPRGLAAVVAVLLLIAVGTAASGLAISPTPTAQRIAGAISGFSGTAVGLGGPPLAVLYRDVAPSTSRPTLAVVFTTGILTSGVALSASGSLPARHLVVGAVLSLAILAGMVLAAPVLRRLSDARIRTGLLAWAAAGSLLALVRVVLG